MFCSQIIHLAQLHNNFFEQPIQQNFFGFLSLTQKDLTEIVNDKVTTTTATTMFLLKRSSPKRFT